MVRRNVLTHWGRWNTYASEIKSSLFQIMACRLVGAKPLSETVLKYCQLGPWKQTPVKFWSKFKHFHSRKCIFAVILSQSRCVNVLRVEIGTFVSERYSHSVMAACWPKHENRWPQRQMTLARLVVSGKCFYTCMVEQTWSTSNSKQMKHKIDIERLWRYFVNSF